MRPLSSSARVWRPIISTLISATTTSPKLPDSNATRPPSVRRPIGGR